MHINDELEIKSKKIAMMQNAAYLINKVLLLNCVFIMILLSQIGIFDKNEISHVRKFLSISALLFCIILLAIAIVEEAYIKKKKKEIEKETKTDNIGNSEERLGNIANYLGIISIVIGVFGESISVTNEYVNFGLENVHGTFPLDFYGIVDIFSSLIYLSSLFVMLSIKIPKYHALKKKYKESNNNASLNEFKEVRNDTIIVLSQIIVSIISIIGRTLSSLESTHTIGLNRDVNNNTIFPLGMIVRISSLTSSIIISALIIYMIHKSFAKQLEKYEEISSDLLTNNTNEKNSDNNINGKKEDIHSSKSENKNDKKLHR